MEVWGVWYKDEFFASVSTNKGEMSVEEIILHWCDENDIEPIQDEWLIWRMVKTNFL